MGLHGAKDIESRFTRYVEELVSVIGHADRAGPFRDYCTGLVMPGERKSVEPMAAITAPGRTAAQHQSLLHFVGQGAWSDDAVLTKVRQTVLPRMTRDGPIEAWIIDDTGIPKKGQHSVGVSHQYCGQLGKQANCQVAVTLSIANHHASLPVAYRLYLPNAWAEDDERRAKAGVPEEITFKTKPQIALEQIRWACEAGLPGSMALVDAGYGHDSKLRAAITDLGKRYVAGIQPQMLVWKPGKRPGRAPKKGHRDAPDTISVKDLALGLRNSAWRIIQWREGSNEWLSSRFARLRVHVASSHQRAGKPTKEWLLISGPRARRSRPGTGSPPCRAASHSEIWSTPPSCAGASSAIIRSSSRRSGSGIMKDAGGVASIIMPRCASQPTDSWSPKRRRFPPQDLVPPRGSRNLPFPTVTAPADPPLRPERHVPNSIATVRRRIIDALVRRLPRCPCCRALTARRSRLNL
jgi:SRSO17 transposase